ncbi:MAG: rod-binding protein [Oligoflexus sp.]
MRDSIQKSDFIDGGNGEEIFRSMLDSEYAKSLASQRSTGLAESIERHLLGLIEKPEQNELLNMKVGLQKYKDSRP